MYFPRRLFLTFLLVVTCLSVGFVAGYFSIHIPRDVVTRYLSTGDPDAEIESLIHSYFDSWNARDWGTYANCFADGAVIFRRAGGRLDRLEKEAFVQGQSQALGASPEEIVELPEKLIIEHGGDSASVVVYWKLTRGVRVRTGVNRFSLWRDPQAGWKIATLYWQ